MKALNEVKFAKKEKASDACDYITFKFWEKGDKKRAYIKDYHGRPMGYVDMVSGEVIIDDRQGNYQAEVDYALNAFMAEYLPKEELETVETVETESYEVTAIKVIADGDTEVQDAVLVHDKKREFHGGDVIMFCVNIEELTSDKAVDYEMFYGYLSSAWNIDDDGIYHAEN